MTIKRLVESVAADLAVIRAELEIAKGNWNRFPAGNPKGGQFAPKGKSGAGGRHGSGSVFAGESGGLFGGSFGSLFKPKAPSPDAVKHPKVDDKGKPVNIDHPTKATGRETWRDAKATATFTPGSATPVLLNRVPLRPWKAPDTPEGWAKVAGQRPALDAHMPFIPTPGKSVGAGVVVMEPDGRVWLTTPTNAFGGYKNTFPKGTAEPGLSLQANAIKETWEETGLKVEIVGVLGDFERTTSKARFYIARRVGGTPADMGWESQAVRLAPLKNALSLLNMEHDRAILGNVRGVRLAKAAAPAKGAWTKQPRWPKGSALGGQWKSYDAAGLPMPPKLGSASNPAYAKAAAAAYDAVKAGDISVAAQLAVKYFPADKNFQMAGGKGVTYHVKEGAKTHQYAVDLLAAKNQAVVAEAAKQDAGKPIALSSMMMTGSKPGGSNPGALFTAGGETYLVKGNAQLVNGKVSSTVSNDRAKNEVMASELMKAAGVGAPDMKLVDLEGKFGGGLGVASKWMNGEKFDPSNPAHVAAAQQDFAVHAWLANYDVVGMSNDNLKIVEGKAVNIDPGGAGLFRAQGLPKLDLKEDAKEFDSMRDPKVNASAAAVYGSMTAANLAASAEKLKQMTDEKIRAIVDAHGPGNADAKKFTADLFIARRDAILAQAGLPPLNKPATPAPAPAPAPVAAPAAPAPAPAAPAKPAAPASPPVVAPSQLKNYAFIEGGSNKFWSVGTAGNLMITHYGKLGTEGQVTVKAFADANAAEAASIKLAGQKTAKGYYYNGKFPTEQKVKDAVAAATAAPPAPAAPAAPAAPPTPAKAPAQPAPSATPQAAAPAPSFKPPPAAALAQGGNIGAMAQFIQMNADKGIAPFITTADGKTKIGFGIGSSKATIGNPPKTEHGAALLAYAKEAQAHVAQMAAKTANEPTAEVKAATALGAKASVPMAMPSKPDKLSSPSNPNTKLIAGVDKIAKAGADFNAGLITKTEALALIGQPKFGSNSFGKKAAAYQASMAAALGGAPTDALGGLASGATMPKQAPAPAASSAPGKPAKAPKFDPKGISEPPSFQKWGTTGKPGPSSSDVVNKANEDAVQAILQTAKATGSIAAIEAMKFPVVDKTTGAVTGELPAKDHPSQWVKGYAQQVINEIHQQLNPPKKFRLDAGNPISAINASYPVHKGSLTGKGVKKIGYYVVLGEPGTIDNASVGITSTQTYKGGSLSEKTYSKVAQAAIAQMPATQRSALKSYCGPKSGDINQSLWKGNPTGQAKAAAQALKALAHDIEPGTVLSRKIKLYWTDLQDLLNATGKVLQEPAVSSTSIDPTQWNGNVQYKMTVGPGVKGLYVGKGSLPSGGALSPHSDEKEVLLPPNTRMLVQRVVQTNGKDPDGFHDSKYLVEVLILPSE